MVLPAIRSDGCVQENDDTYQKIIHELDSWELLGLQFLDDFILDPQKEVEYPKGLYYKKWIHILKDNITKKNVFFPCIG